MLWNLPEAGVTPGLRPAAKGAVVVEVQEIEPRVDVLTVRMELFQFVREIGQYLMVAGRRAAQMVAAPRRELERSATGCGLCRPTT